MIVGIDLGTTNSSCAFYDSGEAVLIPNDRGNRVTPSIVSFSHTGEVMVGEAAKNQAVLNAERTIRSVKRMMGGDKGVRIGDRVFSPEQISSLILEKLKKDAENFLLKPVTDAVITVPAYFNELQRRATRKAGSLAGLNVRRIINEPTAAGLACSEDLPEKCIVLVYDLGGGTFDVSVLEKNGGLIRVRSTSGNNSLGGMDFDRAILKRVLGSFREETGMDLSGDPVILQQLTDLTERAKIELSSRSEAHITLPFIGAGRRSLHLSHTITRGEFEELIRDGIDTSLSLTYEAVRDAGIEPAEVDFIVFSGGSSRIPAIREAVSRLIPAKEVSRVHPEEVVAAGAAIQGHILNHAAGQRTFQDITPLPLGVRTGKDGFYSLIGKNTPIPVRRKSVFTTLSDGQASVEIDVLQGLSGKASQNKSLGKFQLYGIESAEEGVPRIEVAFSIDEDGILTVQAKDDSTGVFQDISITEYSEGRKEGKDNGRRFTALIERTESLYRENRSFLEPHFAREIQEIIRLSSEAGKADDQKKTNEYRIALETIICEIETILKERELKNA